MQNEIVREKTQQIIECFGHDLLTHEEVGRVLRRTGDSVRVTIGTTAGKKHPWVQRLIAGRVRLGRQVFFRADAVARTWYFGDAPLTDAEKSILEQIDADAVAAASAAQNPCL